MCRRRAKSAGRIEQPSVSNPIVKSMMNAAAHGKSASLAGLRVLGDLYVAQQRHPAELDLVNQALAWAEQEAWRYRQLKVTDHDVKRHMKRALNGDNQALAHLEVLASGTQGAAKEADVVLRFVQAKLAESDA